jgi:hypothetical protein
MSEAGRNLGAGRWQVFRRITLPLMRPGLFAGATIVFIWSFTELGTPLMVNYGDVLPVKIFDGLRDLHTPTRTFAMVFVMLGSSVGLYAIGRALFGRVGLVLDRRQGVVTRWLGLLVPMLRNIDKHRAGKSNWQTWHNAAILWAGAVLGDEKMIRQAILEPLPPAPQGLVDGLGR